MVGEAEEDRVNDGRTSSKNGQASRSRHCCALRMTRGRWAVTAADASAGVPQRRLSVTGISYSKFHNISTLIVLVQVALY